MFRQCRPLSEYAVKAILQVHLDFFKRGRVFRELVFENIEILVNHTYRMTRNIQFRYQACDLVIPLILPVVLQQTQILFLLAILDQQFPVTKPFCTFLPHLPGYISIINSTFHDRGQYVLTLLPLAAKCQLQPLSTCRSCGPIQLIPYAILPLTQSSV